MSMHNENFNSTIDKLAIVVPRGRTVVLGIFFQQTNHNILGLFCLANNMFSKHTISVSDILLKASILSYEKSQSTKPNKCDDPIIFYGSGSRLQKQIPYFQIYMSFILNSLAWIVQTLFMFLYFWPYHNDEARPVIRICT